jgi:hypothetical protein
MGEKVAIVGSRDWPEPDAVRDYVYSLSMEDTVVSGGAPGVDTWAEIACMERGLAFLKFPARWDIHGKAAGFIRNKDIAMAADRIVAFHFNNSKGTALTIQLGKDLKKPVIVFNKGGNELDGFIRAVEKPA